MKMVSIMWHSHMNMFVKAGSNLSDILQLSTYSTKKLEKEPERLDAVLEDAADADIIFLYRSAENFRETMAA